jgi:hypothetical protein
MICRLFIFSDETGLKLNAATSKGDCGYCKDCDTCVKCVDVGEHLTKESYSWTLSRRLQLPEDLHSTARLDGFQSAIRIIHPTISTFWLIQLKNDENELTYAILAGSSKVGCKSISQLNFNLKRDHNYDGRDIEVEDFND